QHLTHLSLKGTVCERTRLKINPIQSRVLERAADEFGGGTSNSPEIHGTEVNFSKSVPFTLFHSTQSRPSKIGRAKTGFRNRRSPTKD
ncbi:MAG TPA: hypothetical protein VFH55_07240, partial [Nitrospiria bacterium]|nr:hypothetical protein [Nitrospiria bacterium]